MVAFNLEIKMVKKHGILVNGSFRTEGEELAVINPYDRSVAGVTYMASGGLIEEALSSSAGAFEELKSLPAYAKAGMIYKVAESLKGMEEELARTITAESGKPIKDSRGEVRRAVTTFELAAEEAKRLGGELVPLDISPGSEGRLGMVRRFPVGPVLGITPFNFPLNLVAHKVAPAMACGNPIIIKPAPKTPLTALLLGRIVTDAGWPAGGLNVVPCSNSEAERMFLDERIKKLTFTGSAKVGWMLKAKAGTRKVTLELGGNAGVIVHNDADIGHAAKRCTVGAFAFAGQVCISVQRIFVQREIFEEFKERYLVLCALIREGDPMDEFTELGPMIEEAAAERTEEWIREAVSEGALVLQGGVRRGNFLEPTILTGTRPSMRVCGEEVFAPVVTLEPYDRFEDAVSEVNRGLYGMQAGVFTRDMERIFYAYEKLDVGGVIANDIPTYRVDNMPYGGVKMSGSGREGVRYAIEDMTEPKLLVLKTK